MLYCGECGSPMRIKRNSEWNKSITNRYTCRNASLYRKNCTFTRLFNTSKLEDEIDRYIEEVIQGTVLTPNIVVEKPTDASDVAKKQLSKINSELERAKYAYVEGVFNLAEYKDLKLSLETKKKSIQEELNEGKNYTTSYKKEILLDKINSLWDVYKSVETPSEKRNILKDFIKRIDVYRDRFEITFFI